jgi:hypothetical protein
MIVNTKTLERIEVFPSDDKPYFMVTYRHDFDDPNDNELPVSVGKTTALNYGDDLSSHDQLVQDICNAAWAE